MKHSSKHKGRSEASDDERYAKLAAVKKHKKSVASPEARVSPLNAALAYAKRGWKVFPCEGKIPLTPHGYKDATTDAEQIRQWWKQSPDASIGIATGATSGLVVLDVDPRHGGKQSLATLVKNNDVLPKTIKSCTGGGGWHLFFQHPGEPIKNSASKLNPGLDIRGDGGYVIAPPSRHVSGHLYTWLRHPDQTQLAPLPTWLLALLQAPATPPTALRASEEYFIEGERNYRLFRIACSLRHHGLTTSAFTAALLTINQNQCYPPLPKAEVKGIAISAMRYAAENGKNDIRVWHYRTVEAKEVMPWHK
jgi:putative DNA primase/helicase